jgi:hypothetical protein
MPSYVRYVKKTARMELDKEPHSPMWNFVDFMKEDEIDRITRRCQNARSALWKINDFYRQYLSKRGLEK